MALNEILTLMSMEAQNSDEWKFDHNTTILLIMQRNIASLLQACVVVSNQFENPEKIDILSLINGITETLEWMSHNIEMVERTDDGTK